MDYGHELAVGTFLTPQNQRPQDVVALAWLTEEVGLIDPTAIAVRPLEDAAPVRHIQAALMRDQRAPAARALVDALVEVGQERARRLEKRAKGR